MQGRLKIHGALGTNGCRSSVGLYSTNSNIAGDGKTIWNGENGRITVKGALDLVCGPPGNVSVGLTCKADLQSAGKAIVLDGAYVFRVQLVGKGRQRNLGKLFIEGLGGN